MIILLKTVLSIIIITLFFVIKLMFIDFKNTRKTDGFDRSSPIEKLKMYIVYYSIMLSIISFMFLLLYYIISPMQMA